MLPELAKHTVFCILNVEKRVSITSLCNVLIVYLFQAVGRVDSCSGMALAVATMRRVRFAMVGLGVGECLVLEVIRRSVCDGLQA